MRLQLWNVVEIFLAEVFASAFFMFFGCMSLITGFSNKPIVPLEAGFAFAFVISSIIVMFIHVSGAHLNPAITAATIMLGIVKPEMALVYVMADCLGACLGYQLLTFITPHDIVFHGVDKSFGFCTTVPNPLLSTMQSLFMEFFCTFFLVFMVCGAFDPRSNSQPDTLPIKFSFAIVGIVLTAGQYGVSMNPVRSLAPAIFNGVWTKHWIYWVGPICAGFTAPPFYKALFQRNSSKVEAK
ncbi:hypothetical protein V9T40_000243 [Parthenolecanium corni]|uniref:Aquaporin n=1 Tax=Parthenolecanium corni TaxID=536013 RepID=A0AAN9Y0B6_9HEMI